MSAPVGADVESLCAKCGDVWHVVVAKVGDKIAKVQCKQCSGFHRHKPPPGKEGPAAAKGSKASKAPKADAAAGTGVTKTKAPAKKKKKAEPAGPLVQPDMSRPVRRYSPGESYTSGDRINHPTFGQGVVESSPGAGKIQVSFPSGRRVLAVAKAESTLARPTNNAHQ
jgi:hypothetical protein